VKSLWLLLLAGLCAGVAACAQLTPSGDASAVPGGAPERQILVMLRSSPPHFRPDADYAFGYESQIRHSGQQRIAEVLARSHDLTLVASWPMPALGVDCFVMEAQGQQAVAGLVDAMARDTRVESAQSMNTFHVLDHNDPLFPLQPGARLWHLADVHKVTTGRNVRIAEVDTSVDLDHPDLRGRIATARDFVGTPAVGGEAHGTAVAGIIAARADDGIGIAGVAPDARLMVLRACQQLPGQATATCSTFSLAKALQFALEHDAQVINLSLGGPPDRLLQRLLDVGLTQHIIVVAAADPRVAGGGFPADHPGVLAVASEGDENVPPGALLAPGRDVPATTPGQSWGFVTGSSYAAAEVTGAVALLLERAPTMDVAQVRGALAPGTATAVMLSQGTAIDVCSAVAHTTNVCVCSCVVARGGNSIIAP
jgi:hypothetical protein